MTRFTHTINVKAALPGLGFTTTRPVFVSDGLSALAPRLARAHAEAEAEREFWRTLAPLAAGGWRR